MFRWLVPDWAQFYADKGDCWAWVEVYALLNAIVVNLLTYNSFVYLFTPTDTQHHIAEVFKTLGQSNKWSFAQMTSGYKFRFLLPLTFSFSVTVRWLMVSAHQHSWDRKWENNVHIPTFVQLYHKSGKNVYNSWKASATVSSQNIYFPSFSGPSIGLKSSPLAVDEQIQAVDESLGSVTNLTIIQDS